LKDIVKLDVENDCRSYNLVMPTEPQPVSVYPLFWAMLIKGAKGAVDVVSPLWIPAPQRVTPQEGLYLGR